MSNNTVTIGSETKTKKKNEKRLATDYASSSGLKNTVNYKDGKVYVGGQEMTDYHIDGDSKAHVNKEEMDNALSSLKEDIGIKENKYDTRIENALTDIENKKAWSYNPDEDPAYQAYRDMYQREGQRAYEDAYASMASLTGGYESSAAVTSGAQQLNYYNSQLNDRLGELMEDAYGRYQDDLQYKQDYLSDLMELDEAQEKKNAALYDRFNEATDADLQRTIYEAYTRHMNKANLGLLENELERDDYDTAVYPETAAVDNEINVTKMLSERAENAFNNAFNRGYFTDEEAEILNIEPNADGSYPSPYDGEIQREIEQWNQIGRTKMQNEIDAETAAAIRRAYYGA